MPTRGRHHEHDLVVDPTVLIDQEVPEPLHSPEGLGRWGREHAGMKQLLEEVILRGARRRASSRWSDSLPAAGGRWRAAPGGTRRAHRAWRGGTPGQPRATWSRYSR